MTEDLTRPARLLRVGSIEAVPCRPSHVVKEPSEGRLDYGMPGLGHEYVIHLPLSRHFEYLNTFLRVNSSKSVGTLLGPVCGVRPDRSRRCFWMQDLMKPPKFTDLIPAIKYSLIPNFELTNHRSSLPLYYLRIQEYEFTRVVFQKKCLFEQTFGNGGSYADR